jgi:hypothetical protein
MDGSIDRDEGEDRDGGLRVISGKECMFSKGLEKFSGLEGRFRRHDTLLQSAPFSGFTRDVALSKFTCLWCWNGLEYKDRMELRMSLHYGWSSI